MGLARLPEDLNAGSTVARSLPTMLFSFHLLETTPGRALRLLAQRRGAQTPPGLHHAEYMTLMELGAPVVSPRRAQLRHLALFAAWDSTEHLDTYLADDPRGRLWSSGWHVRLEFLRRGATSRPSTASPSAGPHTTPVSRSWP